MTAGACYAGFLLQGYPDYRFLGVLAPYKALFGEAPPERGTFVKLHAYEKAGISWVDVYERVGKSVISVDIGPNG